MSEDFWIKKYMQDCKNSSEKKENFMPEIFWTIHFNVRGIQGAYRVFCHQKLIDFHTNLLKNFPDNKNFPCSNATMLQGLLGLCDLIKKRCTA